MHVKVSAVEVEYHYKTILPLAAAKIVWNQILKKFQVGIRSLLEWKKRNHDASLPVISNKLSINNLFGAYDTFDGDYIVKNNFPINWVLKDDAVVGPATTLAPNQP